MERRLKLNVALDDWKEADDWQELKIYSKQFLMLMLVSIVFIIVIGVGAYLRHSMLSDQPVSQGVTLQVNEQQVQGMLAEELTYYRAHQQRDDFSMKNFSIWLLEKITNASLLNPSTVVSSELMYSTVNEQATFIHGGSGSDPTLAPQDHHSYSNGDKDEPQAGGASTDGQDEDDKDQGVQTPTDSSAAGGDSATDDGTSSEVNVGTKEEKPIAFIYHTHNRESWNGELTGNERDAQSSKKNITLVGQRLAEELEKLGLGAMASDTDYPTTVPDYEWEYSYKYSRKTVKEAIASNDELQYIFDLHRDSQARKYTTAEINGESYAQVYFIIGQRNPNWKENESFARKLHDKLEAKYPGLSRGIWGKNANSGNAEYNQSLFSQNVLIEVGGIDNTLEECYRTARALAEVIAELHEEA